MDTVNIQQHNCFSANAELNVSSRSSYDEDDFVKFAFSNLGCLSFVAGFSCFERESAQLWCWRNVRKISSSSS